MQNSQTQAQKLRKTRQRKRILKHLHLLRRTSQPPPTPITTCLITNPLPLKNTLIFIGDCLIPLTTAAMRSMYEDLYIKNACLRCEEYLELAVSRRVKPLRQVEQLMPLLDRIVSPFVPTIQALLVTGYSEYMTMTRKQREQKMAHILPPRKPTPTGLQTLPTCKCQPGLRSFLQTCGCDFYRYQLRTTNSQWQLQLQKLGFSHRLLSLFDPEPTDILVSSVPSFFSSVDSYTKYIHYSLLAISKCRGECQEAAESQGETEWVDIQLETADDITISTRFKNLYFQSLCEQVTLTLFEIGQEAIDTIRNIRQETEGRNVLRMVNPEAEKFFERFYKGEREMGTEVGGEGRRCGYVDIQERMR